MTLNDLVENLDALVTILPVWAKIVLLVLALRGVLK